MSSRLLIAGLLLLVAAGCQKKTSIVEPFDAGEPCPAGERSVNGTCRFVCERDGECGVGQRCNLFTGSCEAKPPVPDAGNVTTPCTTGAERCTLDGKAIERCGAESNWTTFETCPTPEGFCQNEKCLACKPLSATCGAGNTTADICKDDGSGKRTVTCAATASCSNGECRECPPNATRCTPDGKGLETCTRGTDETNAWTWTKSGDALDGSCITQVCSQNATGFACQPPACFPGAAQCKNTTTQQVCNSLGAFQDFSCAGLPDGGSDPAGECVNGVCLHECEEAKAQKSYFGCEYWTAVQDNIVDKLFKGGTTSGQGTADSDVAFVVSNRSTSSTTVTVTRFFGGNVQTVKTVTVPPRTDTATKGLVTIKVPWQSIGANTDAVSTSGLQKYGYRIVSSRPVTVYQFNPLDAVRVSTTTCSSDTTCTATAGGGTCVAGKCNYYTFTNDASLLLPAHILGTTYVALTPEHVAQRAGSNTGAATIGFNGMITVVGTENGTQVTVKSTAKTRAGTGVTSIAKGASTVFNLNAYDVLQVASDTPATTVSGSATGNIECGDSPYNDVLCSLFGDCAKLCRVDSDLTGSLITSNKPIAVFGGAACTLRGYLDTACDHVEEQFFPVSTWGRNFIGVRSAPLRLTNNTFATSANAGPDYYKIVAACPVSQCPNGTAITIYPAPADADELKGSGGVTRCLSGTLSANTCKLANGGFVEFRSKVNLTIKGDQPIQVAQMFAGQNATAGTTRPQQGDPSLLLLPPIEQWRSNYTVLTAPGIKDNYLAIAVDLDKVKSVEINGASIAVNTSNFAEIPRQNTSLPRYGVRNHPVGVGVQTINVTPNTGVSPAPGAGVTVYGFDEYVSYGYTGGLDLQTLPSGVNPGG